MNSIDWLNVLFTYVIPVTTGCAVGWLMRRERSISMTLAVDNERERIIDFCWAENNRLADKGGKYSPTLLRVIKGLENREHRK